VIENDGRGFDPATVQVSHQAFRRSRSVGLHGASARERRLGAEIESTPGRGTRLRVSMPTGPSEPTRPQRQWKVVVANREPLLRAGLIRLVQLHEPAIRVAAEACSIGQLAKAASLLRPDVVVVDLTSLANQDFGEYLSAADKLRPAPALVAFAHDPRPADLRIAGRLGVKGYIGRDCTPESISRVLVAAGRGDSLFEAELVGRYSRLGDGPTLTLREEEVRELVVQGLADKQIATRLQISAKTVEKHVGAILRKTGARNRTMLAGLSVD
jgi:DNA-binding NarL/FixJ family response regulator